MFLNLTPKFYRHKILPILLMSLFHVIFIHNFYETKTNIKVEISDPFLAINIETLYVEIKLSPCIPCSLPAPLPIGCQSRRGNV